MRWFVIICVFALPIVPCVVAYSMFFPYITGKNFDFRILVELMAGGYLALATMVPKYRPKRSWLLLAFAAFVLIMGIADLQGVNPIKSIWSNYERMDGWVTIAHLLVYMVVAASVLQTENLWKRLFQWSLFISVLLSFLGFMQVAGIAATGQGGSGGLGARIDATFGNPIYLAVYMMFQVFIAGLLWVQMWKNVSEGRRLWPSLAYGTAIILDIFALLFTGTRGATLGLLGGALLALILYAFQGQASRRLRYITVAIVAVGIICAGGLKLAKNTSFVHSIGFLDRLASISLSDDTTMARLINTETALKGIAERPILGWGQENFAIVFDKYYDPRMYAQEQWFDRVHDTVFDMWVAGGTLGLLAYLSIFFAALWALWKKATFSSAERSILTGLLAGYFVQNLTVFDNVTSWILFGTVLGYIAFRTAETAHTPVLFEKELLPQSATPIVTVLGLALGACMIWFINYPAYAENIAIIAALQPPQKIQDLDTSFANFENAISYHTFGDQEAREQFAQRAMQVLGVSQVPADVKQKFVDTSIKELDAQIIMSPLDARFPLFAGGVLSSAGNYTKAQVYLEKAHELSMKKQTILFQLAQNAILQGNAATGVDDFKQAYELDTDYGAARDYYVAALIDAGNDQAADVVLAPYVASGAAATQQITQAYAGKNEYQKLVPIWNAYVAHNPKDKSGYMTLASVYYKLKDTMNAVATLQALESALPSEKASVDPLILQVQNGTVSQ